jgi:transposase-like protein
MPLRYTDEFKEAAVKQVLENDYSIKEKGRDY